MIIDLSNISQRIYNRQERIADEKSTQHIWFAWYPVSIGYLRWAFMVNVARKYEKYSIGNPHWFTKRYYKVNYEDLNDAVLRKLKKVND